MRFLLRTFDPLKTPYLFQRSRLWFERVVIAPERAVSMEGQPLSALSSPALVVDVDKVKTNAQRMIERCQALGVQLRPHMKTHKTLECADLMTAGSRRCIVVSTLAEACFYADHGFDDIIYAYSLPFDKIERCAALSEKLDLFQVLLDHHDALQQLKRRPLKDGQLWHVWLKLDCGNGRAGVLHSEPEALSLARAIAGTEGVELTGIYAHCGNTYSCTGVEQIQAVAQDTTSCVLQFMEKLKAVGITCKSSIGSTPSCSHPVQDMSKLSEVHPGNYIFYDVQQSMIGSCSLEDVAVRVLTRVIGHCPQKDQLLIDCGWSAISLDGAGKLPTGYAIIEGHPDLKLSSMTQEHGRLEPISGHLDYSKYPLGLKEARLEDYILLSKKPSVTGVPLKSCATAMMHPVYHVHSKGHLLGTWNPTRGW